MNKFFNIVFYIALALGVLYFLKRKFVVPQLAENQLVFSTYEGSEIAVSTYKGKVVVLNFWQTWCAPCIQELPSLNEMNSAWEDIVVLAISDEPIDKVQKFQKMYPNINFVHTERASNFGITQFPTTYILNKEGTKVFSKIGGKDWADPNFIATLKKNWN